MTLPDFFVIGAPKAGTTALQAALARHPQLYLSTIKEPKYFLCDGPPPREGGPGDAHSYREWVWRRDNYERLFDGAPPGTLRGESTPLYLADFEAHRRIQEAECPWNRGPRQVLPGDPPAHWVRSTVDPAEMATWAAPQRPTMQRRTTVPTSPTRSSATANRSRDHPWIHLPHRVGVGGRGDGACPAPTWVLLPRDHVRQAGYRDVRPDRTTARYRPPHARHRSGDERRRLGASRHLGEYQRAAQWPSSSPPPIPSGHGR